MLRCCDMATQGRKPRDTERCIQTEVQIGRYTVHEYMSTQVHHDHKCDLVIPHAFP